MSKEKIFIFDTTLRDGAQTEGVNFSIDDKNKIAKALSKLHSLYEESSKGNKSSKIKFLSACQQIGLLHDKQLWDNFKKSKVKVDENFINQKIKDRNEARKKGNYKLADTLRKELEDNGVIIEDNQDKTIWKFK